MSIVARDGEIAVTGSAVLRVEPDTAKLSFSVTRSSEVPQDCLNAAGEAVEAIRRFVKDAGALDVIASPIVLKRLASAAGGFVQKAHYEAKTDCSITLKKLERLDALMVGLAESGVSELRAPEFSSSKLKELRAKVRGLALAAARSKAQSMCTAAGMKLGIVARIVEGPDPTLNPGMTADDDDAPGVFSPASIAVGASVVVHFRI